MQNCRRRNSLISPLIEIEEKPQDQGMQIEEQCKGFKRGDDNLGVIRFWLPGVSRKRLIAYFNQ